MEAKDLRRIEEFMANHPSILEEFDLSDKERTLYYQQKLRLSQAYERWEATISHADFKHKCKQIRVQAYNQLMTEEESRKETLSSYKSDAYLKGVIATTEALVSYINAQIESVSDCRQALAEHTNQLND